MDFGNFQYAQCGRLHNKSEYWFRQTESFNPCVKKPIPNMNVYFTKWVFLKHTKVWNDFLEFMVVKNDYQKLTSKANIFLTLSQRAHSILGVNYQGRKGQKVSSRCTNLAFLLTLKLSFIVDSGFTAELRCQLLPQPTAQAVQ